jgi:hypothetical protein
VLAGFDQLLGLAQRRGIDHDHVLLFGCWVKEIVTHRVESLGLHCYGCCGPLQQGVLAWWLRLKIRREPQVDFGVASFVIHILFDEVPFTSLWLLKMSSAFELLKL